MSMPVRTMTSALTLAALIAISPAMAKDNRGHGPSRDHSMSKHESRGMHRGDSQRRTDHDWRRAESSRSRSGEYFHRGYDTNNDGFISRQEWRGNDTSFRQLDRNGDGVISRHDDTFKKRR